jgi:hypothetical protein
MNRNGTAAFAPPRPRWWRAEADLPLDSGLMGPEKPPPIKAVLDAVKSLAPGKTISFLLDCEPALLYRILDQKGFDHWAERGKDGQWRIDVFCSPVGMPTLKTRKGESNGTH